MAYFPVCEVLVEYDLDGSGVGADKADWIGSAGGGPEVVGHVGAGYGQAFGGNLFIPVETDNLTYPDLVLMIH